MIKKPPSNIDGAQVIEWAYSGEKPFGVIRYESGEVAAEIFGLALCKYLNEDAIYRFSCNAEWETEQDSSYDTIAEAKAQLPAQYQAVKANWHVYSE